MYKHDFIKTVITYLILWCTASNVCAQEWHYTWNADAKEVFRHIESLRLDEASQKLQQISKTDSLNLIIPYLEDYVDFYTLFIQEERDQFEVLKEREKERINSLKEGPKTDPNHLLLQAEVLLHWAMILAKFESYTAAAINVNKAFKLLKRNELRFPEDMGTKRMVSLIRAGVGTIPQKYLWIIKVLSSLEGSVETGVQGLKEVYKYSQSNPSFVYKNEALVLYSLISTHFGNDADSMHQLLKQVPTSYADQPILIFSKASVALEAGDNDYVIELLENISMGENQLPFHYLSYILGLTKLYRCDGDSDVALLQFVNQFSGQNYIKETYQKLAWHELIHENNEAYYRYLEFARNEGSEIVDADKQAMLEATKRQMPQKDILRARLLCDGGYLEEAEKVMQSIDTSQLKFSELLEYHYRNGRIYQTANAHAKAISCFQRTIIKGRTSGYYFACNAALQTGRIYEGLDQFGQARHFYNECLGISSNAYENSLHQKAKAGLNRIK